MANEKRLIDAAALMESLYDELGEDEVLYRIPPDAVDKAPTVDAVVVVRCRDCTYYNPMGCTNGVGWCEAWQQGRADESFCDCGERKDNG